MIVNKCKCGIEQKRHWNYCPNTGPEDERRRAYCPQCEEGRNTLKVSTVFLGHSIELKPTHCYKCGARLESPD